MKRHHVLPGGAELVPGGARFRLWAPAAAHVGCAIADGAGSVLPMAPEGEGWWALTTAAAGTGSRYRFVVDGTAVPDPASRCNPDDVHGASEVVDPQAFDWPERLARPSLARDR